MKTAPRFLLALAIIAALLQPAKGSAEGGVPDTMTSATISTTRAGYQFTIEMNDKGGLAVLIVVYKGKSFAIPQSELPALKEVDLRQAHVNGWAEVSWGPLDGVILIIPFEQEHRDDPQGKEKTDQVRVSNVVRLLFHEEKLLKWEMAVSLGEKSNAWRLSFREKGQPVTDNGKETGLTNPYWSHTPVTYSTPWSKQP